MRICLRVLTVIAVALGALTARAATMAIYSHGTANIDGQHCCGIAARWLATDGCDWDGRIPGEGEFIEAYIAACIGGRQT